MRYIFTLITLVVVAALIYGVLGVLGIVPLYRCGEATGPNGVVQVCDWSTSALVY